MSPARRIRHGTPAVRCVYGTPAVYVTPAVCCHACYVSKAFFPNGLLCSGQSVPFMPNPNWISEREQMLQYQLIQERQQFEAWRASQAQPQPQSPISSSRLGTMLRSCQGGQPVLKGLDLKTRPQTKLNVPDLLQHLADPPLPRGTTLGGVAQPQGHLRPVLNGLSTDLLLPRTLKPLKLTWLRCCQTCFSLQ